MQQLTDLTAQCAAWRVSPLPDADLLEFLDTVHHAQQMLQAALLHAVHEVRLRDIRAGRHAPSIKIWLRDRLRISPRTAHQLIVQAASVDRHGDLDAALTTGKVNAEQLAVISTALATLPKTLDPSIRTDSAATLTGWAAHLDPGGLRKAGQRILDHVAPEVADAIEQRRLRAAERDAHQQRHVTLTAVGDGRIRLSGILDNEAAAIVTAALDPLCKPDTVAAELAATGQARTPGQRRADALVEVCRLVLAGGPLPDNGGDRPQIAVTVSYDPLRAALGTGILDSGEPVSAETVRRLGCDARILPIILNGPGQILDAGRTRRTATGPLRRALTIRDKGCTFPGCDRPARWCDAHHLMNWADNGPTNLDNLALLCGHHHRIIHTETSNGDGWEIRIADDGLPEFLPPAWLDPTRRPRRNQYHQPT